MGRIRRPSQEEIISPLISPPVYPIMDDRDPIDAMLEEREKMRTMRGKIPFISPPHVRPVDEEKEKICERMRDVLGHLTEELKDLQSRRRGIGIELMDAEREMMKVCEESVMTNECWDAQHLVMELRDDLERIDGDIRLLKRDIGLIEGQMKDFGCERIRWEG